ncbi:DNA/RNA non-specific endonuclease [Oceanospirillum sediminis]|uniref:DNA/RNA non-specific endonuclease n=1 Tax=Oceanospirillum sediminis TaxID=2760088 RepID=A0A839IK22_9GAMM|nr:DNA/RNA non-specific endonuclease [Oceanospirillum sediminis]MBB1485251.1 DNA/RNA non-specific endonuclease [Oceanospirillum sediminis]
MLISILLVAGWGYLELFHNRYRMTGGLPEETGDSWKDRYRVLRNQDFILGYSDLRLNPLWVSYRIRKIPPRVSKRSFPRPGRFRKDWRLIWPVEHSDFTASGYDRGHLAPNYAISRLYGRDAQRDTFLVSNISPQKPDLNRKLWQRLEELAITGFTRRFDTVDVITGPVFDTDTQRLKSWIEIPDQFYKIFLGIDESGRVKSALAFLMPQSATGREPLTEFVVSIDDIEQQTKLNFLTQLPATSEERLEKNTDYSSWMSDEESKKQSRY